MQLKTGRRSSQCRWGLLPMHSHEQGQVPKALRLNLGRSGWLWRNFRCIWALSSIHLSRPFSQGYSCTTERDGGLSTSAAGVLAISHLPASHFGQTCRTPRDPNSEQGNGCHHSVQVSLARQLLGTCISCSVTGPQARQLCRHCDTAPCSAWGSVQSTASIHPTCKQMVWH